MEVYYCLFGHADPSLELKQIPISLSVAATVVLRCTLFTT